MSSNRLLPPSSRLIAAPPTPFSAPPTPFSAPPTPFLHRLPRQLEYHARYAVGVYGAAMLAILHPSVSPAPRPRPASPAGCETADVPSATLLRVFNRFSCPYLFMVLLAARLPTGPAEPPATERAWCRGAAAPGSAPGAVAGRCTAMWPSRCARAPICSRLSLVKAGAPRVLVPKPGAGHRVSRASVARLWRVCRMRRG